MRVRDLLPVRVWKCLESSNLMYWKYIVPKISNAPSFMCPVCGHSGPFKPIHPVYGKRRHAMCPACTSLERHRLQKLVLEEILPGFAASGRKCLQFAPDPITPTLRANFGELITADINPCEKSIKLDMRAISFPDHSVDFVFASHVLEHIKEDVSALNEIYRILRPGGIAVLPVPIMGPVTVEYPMAMPREEYHVRAPGEDYFDRYRKVFDDVTVFLSDDFDNCYQTYMYEDRSVYPNNVCPYRLPSLGQFHRDTVPVCYKKIG